MLRLTLEKNWLEGRQHREWADRRRTLCSLGLDQGVAEKTEKKKVTQDRIALGDGFDVEEQGKRGQSLVFGLCNRIG